MTVRLAVLILVWWIAPAAAVLAMPRARRTRTKVVGACAALVMGATLYIVISSSDSSTAGIGYITLGPLVWLAALVTVFGLTWRRAP
jgi:hypothetical protein